MNFQNLRTHGAGAIQDLCALVEQLGYRGSFQQLTFNNGASVSSLLNFLEDNPGCVESILDWVQDNYDDSEFGEGDID